ncbi:MAG: CotH kinase family protein, partial [Thermoanaerobaculia bacterium]
FDVLVLRAGFNNTWIHWNPQQRAGAQYLHDQFCRDTQLAMGQHSAHGRFVHLYLNGLYWGLYNLTERPNAPFAASYLGGDREEYDALNAENTLDGDRNAWNTLLGLANAGVAGEAEYQAIQQYLDVPNLIDYMILNFYAGNQDWPSHNWYVVRKREPGAGFKFFSWDAERTLEDPASNRTGVSDDGTPARLYSRLRSNPEFRLLFADHLHRHLQAGGALAPASIEERYRTRAAEIDKAVAAESARWGDYRRDVHPYSSGPYLLYTRDDHWLVELDRLVNAYFPARTATLLGQLKSIGLYPAAGAPVFSLPGGSINPGFLLTLSLPAGAAGSIYHTLDGSDPRVYLSGDVAETASAYAGPIALGDTTLVRARTLQGSTWS